MNMYEREIELELNNWYKEIIKKSGIFERASKGIQKKTQELVPRKMQNAITVALKKTVEMIMFGSDLLSIKEDTSGLTLAERDYLVLNLFQKYKNTAVLQGIGFGTGGLLLGVADLPVLMSIKIKFLFDSAALYGFDTAMHSERLFMLNVFQLAFSGREHRLDMFRALESWNPDSHKSMDWERFQIEYRDYLDIAKLLQLLPIVGGVAGGAANFKLMDQLKINVMNSYRMRIIGKNWMAG